MKWFIASDIHGSAYYCRKMIESYKNEKAQRMLLLGDILYHGARNDLPQDYNPKQVISMLSEFKNEILSVRGNCDSEVDRMVLPFLTFAEYIVLDLGEKTAFATHGHVYNEENMLPMKEGDILLCGHTHVPRCEEKDGFVFMNPGSVSIPKQNSFHGYMTLENGVFLWKKLGGEVYNEYRL